MAEGEELVVEREGLEGFVAVDRFVGGLAGGGLRFHPDVGLSELRRLARTMSAKWALLGVPFGGAKLGIRGDPTAAGKEGAIRWFAQEARSTVRDRVFTGPDMGTSFSDMRPWNDVLGQDAYDVVVGRMRRGGKDPTPRRDYRRIMRAVQGSITGVAVARATQAVWKRMGRRLEGTPVAIQGFGDVGRVVAEELFAAGARVVAIADALGCVTRSLGLDPRRLVGPQPGTMDRAGLPDGAAARAGTAWLETEAEILIPAAVADAIRGDNVEEVRARLVVEAGNIPVTEEAEGALHRRGVTVLPDFLVNGGLAGAFGALTTRRWARAADVKREVISRIVGSTLRVVDQAREGTGTPREVARELAGVGGD